MVLEAKHVTKTIHGRLILRDISLVLRSGNIYGFIGQNGAGKRMLFRALSGLMGIDSGEVSLDEAVLHRDFSVLPHLGLIIENAGLYPGLTGMENLAYLAGLNGRIGIEEMRKALHRVGLDPDDRRKYGKYSLGMKQRLAIAQAIMERPDILMLDEPTNALDELGIREIHEILLQERVWAEHATAPAKSWRHSAQRRSFS